MGMDERDNYGLYLRTERYWCDLCGRGIHMYFRQRRPSTHLPQCRSVHTIALSCWRTTKIWVQPLMFWCYFVELRYCVISYSLVVVVTVILSQKPCPHRHPGLRPSNVIQRTRDAQLSRTVTVVSAIFISPLIQKVSII